MGAIDCESDVPIAASRPPSTLRARGLALLGGKPRTFKLFVRFVLHVGHFSLI